MTLLAETDEIVERVRVLRIVECSNRCDVVDVGILSEFFATDTAPLAPMVVSVECTTSSSRPAGTVERFLVNTALPVWIVRAHPLVLSALRGREPRTVAIAIAEVVRTCVSFGGKQIELRITLTTGHSDLRGRLRGGTRGLRIGDAGRTEAPGFLGGVILECGFTDETVARRIPPSRIPWFGFRRCPAVLATSSISVRCVERAIAVAAVTVRERFVVDGSVMHPHSSW